jgi:GDP-4-dehydro-6-deoxy-D-mannose reductase
MSILITGACGFVGKYLVEYLEQNSDCAIFGVDVVDETEILKQVSDDNRFQYIKCDLRDKSAIDKVIQEVKPSYIYHLAGIGNVNVCNKDINLAFDINVNGFINLLSAVKNNNLKSKILLISSSYVYGNVSSDEICLKETIPINPNTEYGVTKACCEVIAKQFYNSYGLEIVILRPFNHFGPGQKLGFIVSDVCSQIVKIEKKEQEPKLYVGNLEVYRDFIDVRDVVKAYVIAIDKCKSGSVYNVCSGKAIYIRNIVEKLIKLSSVDIEIKSDSVNLRDKDINTLYGDNSVFKIETGWDAEYSLEETLKNTLDYWRR